MKNPPRRLNPTPLRGARGTALVVIPADGGNPVVVGPFPKLKGVVRWQEKIVETLAEHGLGDCAVLCCLSFVPAAGLPDRIVRLFEDEAVEPGPTRPALTKVGGS